MERGPLPSDIRAETVSALDQSTGVNLDDQVVEKTAIIVEDDSNTALALAKTVSSFGYSVSVANTLKEARLLMQTQTPELVVLDIRLPDGDGFELMEGSSSRFVVITGDSSQETAIRSLRLRAADFLLKPVGLEDLRLAVGNKEPYLAVNDATTEDSRVENPAQRLVGKTFWEVEKELLQATLEHHGGDKKEAAATLGISLKTLYNRLNAYSVKV